MMVRKAGAKQDIAARLITAFKGMIADGTVLPGQKLPPERDLALSFGVARSSLRQALKVLEIMGVISQRVGDGTYLNTGAAAILGEPMEFLILLDGITFHELMEARLIVEPGLTARAAARAATEGIAGLRGVVKGMVGGRGAIMGGLGSRICCFTIRFSGLRRIGYVG